MTTALAPTLRCAACGTELPPTAKFCLECAHPVAAPAQEPVKDLAERLPLLLVKCGEIHLMAGETGDALRLATDALRLATEQKERGNQAYALLLLAECRGRDGSEVRVAEALFDDALSLTGELGMLPLSAHGHAGLWRLHRRHSARDKAETHLTAAAAMYREMGMRFWVEQLEREAGA